MMPQSQPATGGRWKSAEAKRRSMANLVMGRHHRIFSIPEKAHPLVRQLYKIMNDEHVTVCDLTKRAGVARHTIFHWRTVSVPTLSLFVAVLNALGYDLAIVPKRDVADGTRGRPAERGTRRSGDERPG